MGMTFNQVENIIYKIPHSNLLQNKIEGKHGGVIDDAELPVSWSLFELDDGIFTRAKTWEQPCGHRQMSGQTKCGLYMIQWNII